MCAMINQTKKALWDRSKLSCDNTGKLVTFCCIVGLKKTGKIHSETGEQLRKCDLKNKTSLLKIILKVR